MRRIAAAFVCLAGVAALPCRAAPAPGAPRSYPWCTDSAQVEPLSRRFAAPAGHVRVPTPDGSFGAWLRELPLEPASAKVLLFDGREKPRQDVHAAVIAIDIGSRDLQQCADAIMRLYAEYRYAQKQPIEFHPDPGRPRSLRFDPRAPDPGRARFRRYLTQLFADAGSASLQAELPRRPGPVEPGDVLIQGGHPGHAVLVLDVVADGGGHRRLLLAQSYMPAQSFHVLKNLGAPSLGAWFDESALDSRLGLVTPEWSPFHRTDVHHFRR